MLKVQKLRPGDRLVQQHKFPVDDYADDETLIHTDYDRMFMWDFDHVERVRREYMGTEVMGLGDWVRNVAHPDRVLAFLMDLFKVEQDYPGVKWTGYRLRVRQAQRRLHYNLVVAVCEKKGFRH